MYKSSKNLNDLNFLLSPCWNYRKGGSLSACASIVTLPKDYKVVCKGLLPVNDKTRVTDPSDIIRNCFP